VNAHVPVAVLRRISGSRPASYDGERCEMCGEPIAEPHTHVVNLDSRALMCTCRGCSLLFTQEGARQRYRAVPERYLSFPDFRLGPAQWSALEVPVGLAFFFTSSVTGRTVAFYPGPAGATESELDLAAWETVLADNPGLATLAPDTEAVIVRAPGAERAVAEAHLVPIDACYELVGLLRQVWRGFDGGQEARARIETWFGKVDSRSRPHRQGPA